MVDTEELKDEERAEADAVTCEEAAEAVPCEEAAGEAADAAANAAADGEADEAVAGENVADGEADDEAAEGDDADADAARGGDADVEEELYEIEVAEDDIYAYIVDEDDNEIGFILLDENGEEQEYYYADEEMEGDAADAPTKDDEYDFGITREGVAEATSDMNAIYKDGVEIAAEFKGAFDDIMDGLSFLKKK